MIALLILLALVATVAVTIALGLAVLVVYLWSKWMTALRGLQVLNNAYQSIVLENAYFQALLSERNRTLRDMATKNSEPLYVPNRSNTLH